MTAIVFPFYRKVAIAQLGERKTEENLVILRLRIRLTVVTVSSFYFVMSPENVTTSLFNCVWFDDLSLCLCLPRVKEVICFSNTQNVRVIFQHDMQTLIRELEYKQMTITPTFNNNYVHY